MTARVVRRLDRLGYATRRAGENRAAEWVYRLALAVPCRDAVLRAGVRNNLAVLFKHMGRFDEAAVLYREALACIGPDPTILHNLGGLAHAAGRPADGERPARDAVELRAAACGADHPATAADEAALASILDALGQEVEAIALLEHALGVFEGAALSYEVGVTLGSLGTIDARAGRLAPARERLQRALALKEQALGSHHPELAPTLGTLGVVERRLGHPGEARRLYERAHALLAGRVAADHPQIATLEANLTRVR